MRSYFIILFIFSIILYIIKNENIFVKNNFINKIKFNREINENLSLDEKFIIAEENFKNKNYDKSIYYYSLIVKYHYNSDKFIYSLIKIAKILYIKKEYKKSLIIQRQISIINT